MSQLLQDFAANKKCRSIGIMPIGRHPLRSMSQGLKSLLEKSPLISNERGKARFPLLDRFVRERKATFHKHLGKVTQTSCVMKGLKPMHNQCWGDFEATSYDGASTNTIWLVLEYAGANQNWAAYIGQSHI
jgi:hypothetical protein